MKIQFREYYIVPFDESRHKELFELIDKNRSRLEDFFSGTVARTRSLNDTKVYCDEMIVKKSKKEYFPFIIHLKNTDQFVGFIDLKNCVWNIPKGEIGYFVDKDFEGKGLISQGLELLLKYLIEEHEFKKLVCRIGTDNIGSQQVALKNGFELEGTIKRDYKTTGGRLVDLSYYGKLFD